ncbi:MAG: hypothetical protein U0136_14460 [Bdellovibrionota bacterium]
MRKASRFMPPYHAPEPTAAGKLFGYATLATIGTGLLFLVCSKPLILPSIGLFILAGYLSHLQIERRSRRLARDRSGESIETFAKSFDYRTIDTWIIRATWDAFRPLCKFSEGYVPLRADDHIEKDIMIGGTDLDDVFIEIATRAGRSLEDGEDNPFYDKVHTVRDLVMFLHHQPWMPGYTRSCSNSIVV